MPGFRIIAACLGNGTLKSVLEHCLQLYSAILQADEVGWGDGGEADVALDPPTVRQAIGWSFALRNIRRLETEEAAEQLRRETGAETVRNVKARHTCHVITKDFCVLQMVQVCCFAL